MQPSSKVLFRIALLLCAALAAYFALRPSPLSDTQQIEAALDGAQQAAERRDANGVLQIVSGSYKDGAGLNNEQLALLLRRAFGQQGRQVRVSVSPPRVTVQGDAATSVSTVTVRRGDSGLPAYNAPITFHWKREDGTRLLVVPTKVWRVVGADYTGDVGGEAF